MLIVINFSGTVITTTTIALGSTCRFREGEGLKYLDDAKNLIRPERNTLLINFQDVEEHSTKLATVIQEHYYQ